MLNYNIPEQSGGAHHHFVAYQPAVSVYQHAGWSTAPIIPTTSNDYMPQIMATTNANSYYGQYIGGNFPVYAGTLDSQQFGAYPSFNTDSCLNPYPTPAITSDSTVQSYLPTPPSSALCDQNAPPFIASSRRPIKREPSNSPPADMICQWLVDSSGSTCGRQFYEQRKFVDHLNNDHVGALDGLRHVCLWQDCPRALREFKAKYKLINHIRVHTQEKPFVCCDQRCKKRFARSENLKIHERIHTGEKPFKCASRGCHKTFANSSDRKKHMHVHSKNKPYNCAYCNKKYTHPSSLRKHHKQMHPDQPSINMGKGEDFDESSDSGHASAVTPILSDQNTYVPNNTQLLQHQQQLANSGHLFQPQIAAQHQTINPSKDFQQRSDVFNYFPTSFNPHTPYYHQC